MSSTEYERKSEQMSAGWFSASTDVQGLDPEVGSRLFRNFILMAVCFSINHGTVTALLALATVNLGHDLGNLQNALLYCLYTITALCFAKIIVARTGYKYGIVAGLTVYVVYVGSFIIADKVPFLKWPASVFGGCMGGIAAGFLWTAQGAYFSRNAALYAEATGMTKEAATLKFAGWFALPYLGFEVLFKLLQSYIGLDHGPLSAHWSDGKNFIYVINTIFAVLAVFGSLMIMPMEEPPSEEASKNASEPLLTVMSRQAASAIKLFVTDPKMPLMMGMNVSFGVVAAYINSYTTGIIIGFFLGGGYGGYLTAITAAVAALLSYPLTNMSSIVSMCCGREMNKEDEALYKKSAMVIGPICFCLVSLLPIVLGYSTDGALGNWGGLLTLFILQGVGRGVWEATNKAIFAEYFAYDTVGAFSNLIIQNGSAATICFFINAYGDTEPKYKDCTCHDPPNYIGGGDHACHDGSCPVYASMAWAGVVFSVLAIVGFLVATALYLRGVRTWGQIEETESVHEPLAITDPAWSDREAPEVRTQK